MPLDTQTFFYVILSGFITVWTFRYLTKSQKAVDSFEYLGLSAFWGLVILFVAQVYTKWYYDGDMEKFKATFVNPLSTGFQLSILFSPVLGWLGSLIAKPLGWLIEKMKKVFKVKK